MILLSSLIMINYRDDYLRYMRGHTINQSNYIMSVVKWKRWRALQLHQRQSHSCNSPCWSSSTALRWPCRLRGWPRSGLVIARRACVRAREATTIPVSSGPSTVVGLACRETTAPAPARARANRSLLSAQRTSRLHLPQHEVSSELWLPLLTNHHNLVPNPSV